MSTGKILVVDDDKNILDVLKYNFTKEGYEVVITDNGISALELARQLHPAIILLDIMLPGMNGFDVCRTLRKEMTVPILILTARTEEVDRIVGLEIGADDYISKPFSIRELTARVHSILRRSQWQQGPQSTPKQEENSPQIVSGELELDTSRHEVLRHGVPMKLSPLEFKLLEFLMRHHGQVFSREQLIESVWAYDYEGGTRTVDVHIRALRRQIEVDPAKPRHLMTVHGFGYKFEP